MASFVGLSACGDSGEDPTSDGGPFGGDTLVDAAIEDTGIEDGTPDASVEDTGADDTGIEDASPDVEPDTAPSTICGDALIEGDELCDGPLLGDASCSSLGFAGGTLLCSTTCDRYDFSGCVGECAADCEDRECGVDPICGALCGRCEGDTFCDETGLCVPNERGPVCGDGVLEIGELCDGDDLGASTCTSLGYVGGTLTCATNCTGFDVSGCERVDPAVCGDNLREGVELCDGADLAGRGCDDFGFVDGTLTCAGTCDAFVFDACNAATGATCGNDAVEPGELCDGLDLRDTSCTDLGFDTGDLICDEDCLGYDSSACESDVVPATCGDNRREGVELCDGADLAGRRCADFGFVDGTLVCAPTCDAFVFDACNASTGATCGNDAVEPGELCDGLELRDVSCADLGFDTGDLICDEDCLGYDRSSCERDVPPAVCGDEMIGVGELCDGDLLQGATCTSLGFDGGTLACAEGCRAYANAECFADCTPACGDRECGLEPNCGVSCGMCTEGECTDEGLCVVFAGPPTIERFEASPAALVEDGVIIFELAVADPQGPSDVVGATLENAETGVSYGFFTRGPGEATFSLRTTWNDIQSIEPLTFEGEATRSFLVRIADTEGASAEATLTVDLVCPEGTSASCDGVCVSFDDRDNCGACDNACSPDAACIDQTCDCGPGRELCGGVCTLLGTQTDCGACGDLCGARWAGSCEENVCECEEHYVTCADGTCQNPYSTLSCGDNCLVCGENEWCDGFSCRETSAGDLRMGINEILEGYDGTRWETVCDSVFGVEEAEIACRQLGGTIATFQPSQRANTTSSRFDSGFCAPWEYRLDQCLGSTSSSCPIDRGVRLTCAPPDAPRECEWTGVASLRMNEVFWRSILGDDDADTHFIELAGTPGANIGGVLLSHALGTNEVWQFRFPLGATVPLDGFIVLGGALVAEADYALPAALSTVADSTSAGASSFGLLDCEFEAIDSLELRRSNAGSYAREGWIDSAHRTGFGSSWGRDSESTDTNWNTRDYQSYAPPSPGEVNGLYRYEPLEPFSVSGILDPLDRTWSVRPSSTCSAIDPIAGPWPVDTYQITNTEASTASGTFNLGDTGGATGFISVHESEPNPNAPWERCLRSGVGSRLSLQAPCTRGVPTTCRYRQTAATRR